MTSKIGLIGLAVMGQVSVLFSRCRMLYFAVAVVEQPCATAEFCPERR